jgi:hypothetical protein
MTEKQEHEFHMRINCLMIESLVKSMVVKGETDNEKLVKAVDEMFPPQDNEEMEAYSEAIIYAKYSILN